MSDSLWPHGLQHARIPCPSLSPGVCSNSNPLSWWCYPTISSGPPFSSCSKSFPESRSFPMSQLFALGGQSIGASASTSVSPMNIQGWFPLGFTGLISLLSGSQGLFTGGKGAWDCVPTCLCLGPCIQLWFDFNFTAAVRLKPVSLRGRWYWAWTWESNRLGFESHSTTAPFQAESFGHPPSPGISWVALAAPVFQHDCVGCKWPT